MKFNFSILMLLSLNLLVISGCKQTAKPIEDVVLPATVSTSAPIVKAASTSNADPKNFPFDIQLKSVKGETFNSSDIFKDNGKPTVLLFWLTTCRPCHMKLAAISPVYEQWQEEADFNLYAISGDFPNKYESFVNQTTSKGWKWDTYWDMNRAFREVLPGQLNGYPQTFIFDKDGKLAYQDKRYRAGDADKLLATIKRISQG